jgi:hypothetical protein
MPIPKCPHCQANNLTVTAAVGRKGDLAVCPSCYGAALIEVDPLRLRLPENKEEARLCDGALAMVLKDAVKVSN